MTGVQTCALPISSRCWGIPFTVASVPTGMKTGVSTSPCGVVMTPVRAGPAVAEVWKEKDTGIEIVAAAYFLTPCFSTNLA